MGTNDRLLDALYGYSEFTARCPKCGKKYICVLVEQEAGFRCVSEDVCPHCGNVNGRSMEVEYMNRKG